MKKFFYIIFFLALIFLNCKQVFAQTESFVSVVNPVRGDDFWTLSNQDPATSVNGEAEILQKSNIVATWLIRFDALDNKEIISKLKELSSHEKGLFLEVTPTWAKASSVEYHKSENWHSAGSAFLTGYERNEREKLIDLAFFEFKNVFGSYPASVGAWWIDSYSLNYMQKKYGIVASLIVSDQYSTDNYQIWGQYFSTPYYPDRKNALHPAQSLQNKIPIVLLQWAPRDPVNGYGNGVFESTFSLQANDYIDYHKQNTSYFSKLLDIYSKQQFNQFGQAVIGLENTYQWDKYKQEYKNQIDTLVEKRSEEGLRVVTTSEFASWYRLSFPDLSPPHLIIADDPLGSNKKAVWFMNPYYRAGWFFNQDGSVFRDIRQYVEGEEEICFQKKCNEVNFATFATRVLDEVTYGHKWIIDEGKISDFKVAKEGEKYVLNYKNEGGNSRKIEFLQRDIGIDGKILSIDEIILNATRQSQTEEKKQAIFEKGGITYSLGGVFSKIAKFLLFLTFALFIPGIVALRKIVDTETPFFKKVFLCLITGSVLLTIFFYIVSLLNLRFLIYVYIIVNLCLFFKWRLLNLVKIKAKLGKGIILSVLVIIMGTIFQNIPMFKNGLVFPFGMGFWGPNTHDGVWHISLINQLIKSVPPQNPIFSDTILKNYHYFYDLLIAATASITKISPLDLVFRFYPILLSLLLGIGTYFLATSLFKKINPFLSLYLVYFAGSFGWIVEYIKHKNFAGESAFWANQSISFNLNPPFAISLLIVIAILILLQLSKTIRISVFVLTLLSGALLSFKSYAAVLVISAFFLIGIFKRNLRYLLVGILSLVVSMILFLLNFNLGKQFITFSPFWLIHSMIDSVDRVGWARLSLAREAGLEGKNWFKFISAEVVGFFLFIIGNLGIRFLSIFSLLKLKKIFKDNNLSFILVLSILSLLIPILFIQSGNPWNIIQFSYYGLYITSVIAGAVISYLIFNLSKPLAISVAAVVIILAPINSVTTATYYTGYLPHGRIDKTELEALKFLSDQKEGVVLTYPYNKNLKKMISEPWPLFIYDSTSYVSAFSNKAVFLEDEPQNEILLTEYKRRLVTSKDFFSNPNLNGKKFLETNKIKYIYMPKTLNKGLDESFLGLVNIFENNEAIIFKVKE